MSPLLSYALLPLSFLIFSSIPVEAKFKFKLRWYKPVTYQAQTQSNTQVVLVGRTSPNTTITIDAQTVTFGNANIDVKKMVQQMVENGISVVSKKKTGYFHMPLELPPGITQFNLKFEKSGKVIGNVLTNVVVSDGNVILGADISKDTKSVAKLRKRYLQFFDQKYGVKALFRNTVKGYWLVGGIGANLQTYSQSLADDTNIEFSSFSPASISLNGTWFFDNGHVSLKIRNTPGSLGTVPENFTAEKDSYNWLGLGVEYGFTPEKNFFGPQSRFAILGGIQMHRIPFLVLNFDNSLAVDTHQILSLNFGPWLYFKISEKWLLEFHLRYQYPFAASGSDGNEFSIKPKIIFDGLLAANYALKKDKHYLGLFWFGQWHNFDFTFVNASNATSFDGQQSLFFTNVELRYSYKF